ncbi:putative porin [Dysgonomonas sp. Marseille-P4677]|uniref:putative porin n=1 Tax=Dysgonomonas sp. Marseille-P4677 TaxID=2364790 RepID=UPI0019141C45|nr:putative porin [Dysgonomonas sp. Marseille-P4677]MBK5721607.1 putative porin [Dysgonomonas sp. Marseille-P4677]
MKKNILTVFLFLMVFSMLNAQNKRRIAVDLHDHKEDSLHLDQKDLPVSGTIIDTAKVETPSMYVWKITPRLGERVFLPMDTLMTNFHQKSLVDGQSVAMGYLGNIGSPAQSKIFFDRPESSRFVFEDVMYLWRKNPGDQYFMNTKVPYSNVTYQSGGGGQSAEHRLQTELSMNMGKKLNVGFDFDYVYSRGFYQYLSNKQMSYDFYASYIGDRYKMHAFLHNNNFTNVENGGISDMQYITNPDAQSVKATGYSGKSLDIPVRMQDTWNKMRGKNLYVTNRYDLGSDEEEYVVNDSTKAWRKKENYVPLASAIFTTHYTDQRRRFKSDYIYMDQLYEPFYKELGQFQTESTKYDGKANDFMSYYSFKNTLALAMNEDFRSWTKFGLTAFIEYDMRKYSMPGEIPGLHERFSDDALTVGGVLSKEKGKYLKYRASAEFNLMEGNDYKLEGEIGTMLSLFGKNVSAKANAYVKSIRPSFFQRNFSSKYWNWRESETNYNNTNRVYIGGEINLPELSFSKTRISGGVETIKNYIYFDSKRLQQQSSGDVQIVSLRLDQNLKTGIFHWDNQIVYQMSSNQDVIPLPDLSLYTNLYLKTKIAKVMTLQLGADAHFHTKYYMPGYEPLTMQFYNQKDMKLGEFPVVTAYINLHLKYTRFFLMMYNLAEGMGERESFSLYRYPVNPRIFKLGIAWRFNN